MGTSLHRPSIICTLSSSILAIYSLGWSAGIALASSIFRTQALAMSLPHDTPIRASRTIKVVVWSDLACPWCYVGHKRLAQGIAKFHAEQERERSKKSDGGADRQVLVEVQVEWKPYMIDPGTNAQGEDMEAYCRRRWGGAGWTHHLRQEGSKSGANFGNWKWWSHTGLAHQWVQYGKERHGASTDLMNSILFEALYESGRNLSSLDVLVDLAREHFP
jgi:predicted DsbA family dithiol-disulfide isomerase